MEVRGSRMNMNRIDIGQEFEFIEPTSLGERMIDKGTRVRVGYVERRLPEPIVTVVLLGTQMPETLTMPRHVLTLHCLPRSKGS